MPGIHTIAARGTGPGAGHAPHQETPRRFAALLTDFIAGLAG